MSVQIKLGDVAKDKITGFKGVVICDSKWLHGCRRLTLQPQELKDGKPLESQTFDEPQLQLVRSAVAAGSGATGGPRPEPTRNVLRSILIVFALLFASTPLYAIDSIAELLKKGANAEKKREKDAKKAGTGASFSLTSGEVITCVWLAKVGDELRYLRTDGRLVSTPVKDAVDVKGTVLTETPALELVVHTMHCQGGYCKPTVKTVRVPAWPSQR